MSRATEVLREAADAIDGLAMTDRQLDIVLLVGFHLKHFACGAVTDRCEETKLMLRMLDRA